MKLNILSDLHLSVCALEVPRNDADVVILAGDIGRPAQAICWASAFRKPVLYVPGNHEFYERDIAGTVAELVCNPRGYAKGGVDENPHFDADFSVVID